MVVGRARWFMAAVAAVLAAGLGAPPASADPVMLPAAADPSIIRDASGVYHAYATSDDWGDGKGMRFLPHWISYDLQNWIYSGNVFSGMPGWVVNGQTAWAPQIVADGNRFLMYYAVGYADNPCIGMASSPSLNGPWNDLGHPVFCAKDVGIAGTIDPFVWNDNGNKTMVVGNFGGVYAIPLNPDGSAAAGKPVQIADQRFEAPYIVRKDNNFYLFASAGNCCSGPTTAYRVLAGRSPNLFGPYVDRDGRDLNLGGGELVVAGSDKWAGPGHNAVTTDDAGNDWMLYHAIPRAQMNLPSGAPNRPAILDRLTWPGGWPKVGDGSPESTLPEQPIVKTPVHVNATVDGSRFVTRGAGRVEIVVTLTAPQNAGWSGKLWYGSEAPGQLPAPEDITLKPGERTERRISIDLPGANNVVYSVYAYAGADDKHVVDAGVANIQSTGGGRG
ncbi:MAG: family 43 glycosylhydrolase [Nocardiaceae bacterium]|nr:family 43 glycosylhydrolase [Nocardiaceae bacterium]